MFSFNVLRTMIYFHVYIILDFLITYINASVLCQSECACLHKTVNMMVFFAKSNENTYPKGRALMQICRVVPITKRVNTRPRDWSRYVSGIKQSVFKTNSTILC